jgi:hypothetical protein
VKFITAFKKSVASMANLCGLKIFDVMNHFLKGFSPEKDQCRNKPHAELKQAAENKLTAALTRAKDQRMIAGEGPESWNRHICPPY